MLRLKSLLIVFLIPSIRCINMAAKHKKKNTVRKRRTSLVLALVIGDCNTGRFFEVDKLKIQTR